MHSQILIYFWALFAVLAVHSCLVSIWEASKNSGAFWLLQLFLWPLCPFLLPIIADSRYGRCSTFCGTEFILALVIFTWALDAVKQLLLLLAWFVYRPTEEK